MWSCFFVRVKILAAEFWMELEMREGFFSDASQRALSYSNLVRITLGQLVSSVQVTRWSHGFQAQNPGLHCGEDILGRGLHIDGPSHSAGRVQFRDDWVILTGQASLSGKTLLEGTRMDWGLATGLVRHGSLSSLSSMPDPAQNRGQTG